MPLIKPNRAHVMGRQSALGTGTLDELGSHCLMSDRQAQPFFIHPKYKGLGVWIYQAAPAGRGSELRMLAAHTYPSIVS